MPPKPESSLSDPSQSWKTRSSSGTGKSDFLGFSQQEDYLLEKVTASDYGLWLVIIIYSYKHIDMFISWHLFIYRDTLDYILYTDSCMGHSPFWFSKPRFTCSFKSFPTYRHHYACIYIGSFFCFRWLIMLGPPSQAQLGIQMSCRGPFPQPQTDKRILLCYIDITWYIVWKNIQALTSNNFDDARFVAYKLAHNLEVQATLQPCQPLPVIELEMRNMKNKSATHWRPSYRVQFAPNLL